MNIALVAAAGSGSRVDAGKNKLLVEICERPILSYTLEALASHSQIDEILVLIRSEDRQEIETIVSKLETEKPIKCILGGETRQKSVIAGVNFIRDRLREDNEEAVAPEVILVHNGANPLVTEEEISASIEAAKTNGAAVVGRAVADTLKQVSGDEVIGTIPRKDVVGVQTPQTIQFDLFVKAIDNAGMNSLEVTDDVSMVEAAGGKVKLIAAGPLNFKITNPCDLDYLTFLITHYGFPCRYRPRQSPLQRGHDGIAARGSDVGKRDEIKR